MTTSPQLGPNGLPAVGPGSVSESVHPLVAGPPPFDPGRLPAPDDFPAPVGAMCGACGSGHYHPPSGEAHRVICTRCGNGRPRLG
jgi:hypothetical protein